MVADVRIISRSLRQIVKDKLRVHPYCLQRYHMLTAGNKELKMFCCEKLLHYFNEAYTRTVVFINKKMFTLEATTDSSQ